MVRKSALFVLAVSTPLVLAACGDTTEDRAVSGAGIGAASGAVIGAVTGIGPVGGAFLGAAVGGAAGALTDSSQVNLGQPAWRSGSSSSSAPPPASTSAAPAPAPGTQVASLPPETPTSSYDPTTVRNIQAGLQRLGYDPGPADGNFGSRTDTAIRRYQQDNHLPVDGVPTASLWDQIRAKING